MPRPTHVLFAGGGSTGYLHPGLAVAAYLKQRLPQARITFAGTGKAFERHSVRANGHEYVAMPSQPVPRNPFRAMRFVTDNVAGYWASRWYLKEHHVSLVVGLGGYASAPTVRAATSRGIPTVLLEQNAVPSPVTRWLSRSADMVCAGFDDVRAHLPADTPLVVTGNPARPAFEQLYRAANEKSKSAGEAPRRPTGKRRLVVIGGVGGARSLNESMPLALQQLGDRLHGWEVVHQTGEGHLQDTLHPLSPRGRRGARGLVRRRIGDATLPERFGRLPGRRHNALRAGARRRAGSFRSLYSLCRSLPIGQCRRCRCSTRRNHDR